MKSKVVIAFEVVFDVFIGINFDVNRNVAFFPASESLQFFKEEVCQLLDYSLPFTIFNIFVLLEEHIRAEIDVYLWQDIDIVQRTDFFEAISNASTNVAEISKPFAG